MSDFHLTEGYLIIDTALPQNVIRTSFMVKANRFFFCGKTERKPHNKGVRNTFELSLFHRDILKYFF